MTFCSGCGEEIPGDAKFCPKCGEPTDGSSSQAMDPRAMRHAMKAEYRAQRHAYRHARHMAWWGGWSRSPELALIDAVFGGLLIAILGGLLFLAAAGASPLVTWENFWAYFLLGIGVLLLLRGIAALVMPGRPFGTGSMVGSLILIVLGTAGISASLTGWDQYIWAGIIVFGGLLVILAGIAGYIITKGQSRDV